MLDSANLILESCKKKSFKEFDEDKIFQSAIVRQFEILGEASIHVSDDIKFKYPKIEWDRMRRFRNFLIHEYFRIDNDQIWTTIIDLPEVKYQLEIIINDLQTNS